jgi:acetyl-CoA carboxylase biotin carboxyl carrier protein
VSVPPVVVTDTEPVWPVPSTAVIEVALTTLNDVAAVPPKLTAVTFWKFVPVMVTTSPSVAEVGVKPVMVGAPAPQQFIEQAVEAAPIAPVAASVQAGTPISSPMMGIYYAASSPSADPYVREGDTVTAGQVIGLIEAMKVFNEIQSTVSGTVKKIVAQGGDIVNPGDPLMYIG